MYAIVETGGKQYKVTEGDIIRVEKLAAEAGEKVELDKVLVLGEGADIKVGTPYIEGAKVVGEVVENGKGQKDGGDGDLYRAPARHGGRSGKSVGFLLQLRVVRALSLPDRDTPCPEQ